MKILLILIFMLGLTSTFGEVLDSSDYPEVSQREFILTNSKDFSYVQSNGLRTCVALVIYSKTRDLSLLAHIDSSVDTKKSISNMLKLFLASNIEKKDLDISLYGGSHKDSALIDQIERDLEEIGIEVLTKHRNTKENISMNIILDTYSGEVSFFKNTIQSEDYKTISAKLNRLKFISKKMFRHQSSIGGGDSLEMFLPKETRFIPTEFSF